MIIRLVRPDFFHNIPMSQEQTRPLFPLLLILSDYMLPGCNRRPRFSQANYHSSWPTFYICYPSVIPAISKILWYSNRNPTAYWVFLFLGPNADQECTIADEIWKILRFNVSDMIGENLKAKKLMTCVCKLEKSLVKSKNQLWHAIIQF